MTLPESTPSPLASAFELLHSGVQRQLWRMGWTELRPLQSNAIRALMGSEDHLILSAATAAGKTEAAFLPILSKIADDAMGSVRAMYIGPLKALINDQFTRVGELCSYLEVPVHHWHGDVPASRKAKLVVSPGGVLLITPESVESLFVNRSQFLRKLFGGLQFIVIDELHSFLDNERGLHLRSLLYRLGSFTQQPLRFVALSATLGDSSIAMRYLSPDRPNSVRVISSTEDGKELKLRIHGYVAQPPKDDERPAYLEDMAGDIVTHCHGAANLMFANAKATVEELADECQRIGVVRGIGDRFMVHHGSLSAEIREDAETTMKSGAVATTFCSSTLEMGIDIGSVRMIGQVGPPWSVASLKQRLGRGGRRAGEARILRMYIPCDKTGPESTLFDRLHLDLIQAIAVTELMLAGWVEPPVPPVCDLSTLAQQIISVIAQTGGAKADLLYEQLCGGAFRDIEKPLFVQLLRQLAAKDVIEQMPEGDLILGLLGERLRKDKGFYAVFPTPEDYAVLYGSQRLGTVSMAVEVGEHLLLAGRRWQATLVDHEERVMHVKPARGWKAPKFASSGGVIHPRVRQQMRIVLSEGEVYPYLDSVSLSLLQLARREAQSSGACSMALVPLGPQRTALMTWTGTRIQDTLRAMFATKMIEPGDESIALVFALPPDGVRRAASMLAAKVPEASCLAKLLRGVARRKYDWLLSDDLRCTSLARGWVDTAGATAMLTADVPDWP